MLSVTKNEIEKSKAILLDAIAGSADITFIRIHGDVGDQLSNAGARRLLSGLQYKETGVLNLSGAGGDLALVAGGEAWRRPDHDMSEHLSRVEEKFRRVVVLPSSFDISVTKVREALRKTRALVFARERVSYEQIRGLCKSDLAHDCAFFFDYSPYLRAGRGALHAFRADADAPHRILPADNNDISVVCETLDEWLWTISRHEVIRTDRAQVMIAAAMMGKRVFYRDSCYHDEPAIAQFALQTFPVEREEELDTRLVREKLNREAKEGLSLLPRDFFSRGHDPEIAIVMLSYHRLEQTINAIKALKENVVIPFKLLLIDNNSGPDVQERLKQVCASYDFIELILLDENLGCSGGRAYAMRRVQTRYVMLIDNDIEVFPGTVEHLLHRLETNPGAMGATGRVVLPDGSMHLCGAGYRIEDGVLNFELFGFGHKFDNWKGASGPCQWVPGCLTLLRREALIDCPYDPNVGNYYDDLEWCYRFNQSCGRSAEGVFQRVVESVALHFHEPKGLNVSLVVEERRKSAMKYIEIIAYFYKIHGLVIPNIFNFVPELGPQSSPINRLSARLFLTMTNTYGTEWMLEKWNSGELSPLFAGGAIEDERKNLHEKDLARIAELEQNLHDIHQSNHWRLLDRYWRLRRAIMSLFTGDNL